MSIKSITSKIGIALPLCALLLGDVGRIKIANYLFVNIADLCVVFTLVLGYYQKTKLSKVQLTYCKWIIAVSVMLGVSLALKIGSVPTNQLVLALLYPLRFCAYLLLPIALARLSQGIESTQAKWLTATYAILAIVGILQLVLLPNLRFLEYLGYDPHYARVVSTWLDPNFFGAGLVFALIFTLANQERLTKFEFTATTLLLTLALILTFSRSAYIFAAISLVTYTLLQRSIKLFVIISITGLIALTIYMVPRAQIESSRNIERDVSANLRLKSYGQALTLFQQQPLTGIGFNLMRYEKNKQNMVLDTVEGGNSGGGVDSSWLLLLATTGIIGTVAFSLFWVRIAYFSIEASAPNFQSKRKMLFAWIPSFLAHGTKQQQATVALFIGWSIHANFINSLFYPYILITWAVIFSFALGNTTARDRQDKELGNIVN